TDKETLIATIPVGYGDGYPRSLSNKGCCIIRGKKAPIIGRVCMDQMMVDVTDVPGVCVDDEVILIGCAGNECISADWLGDIADRFNYELVCDLGKRVSRIY
ncbi:MAG: alanine racemase, partial [Lachnospiraceae bacterium]|nr:alanine racemase [Lachnospiraceae bacterium]